MDADFVDEHGMLAQRRALVGHGYAGAREEPASGPLPDAPALPDAAGKQWAQGVGDARPYVALAFSGGGIRSATFSLGVLQAVAQAPSNLPLLGGEQAVSNSTPARPGQTFANTLLSRFDYLSTVSGGGYLGAFLVALFKTDRLRAHTAGAAAAEAVAAGQGSAGAGAAAAPGAGVAPGGSLGGRWSAADDAVGALRLRAPGRMRSREKFAQDDILKAPLAWLRENSRYLLPTGTGDAFYALAMAVRNWISLHYVIGTLLFTVFATMLLLRATVPMLPGVPKDWVDPVRAFSAVPAAARQALDPSPPASAPAGKASAPAAQASAPAAQASAPAASAPKAAASALAWADLVWRSPFLVPAGLALLFLCLPMGIAYWMAYQSDEAKVNPLNSGWWIGVALAVGFGIAGTVKGPMGESLPRQTVWQLVAVLLAEATLWYMVTAVPYWRARRHALATGDKRRLELVPKLRVKLTKHLQYMLQLALGLLLLGALETLGQTLYLLSISHSLATALTPAGVVGALVWLAKLLAGMGGGKAKPDSLLAQVPLTVLAGAAGLLIMTLVAVLWCFAVNWALWEGGLPPVTGLADGDVWRKLLPLVAGGLVLAIVVGQFPVFINLSGLQPFYGARLTRAYVGASNSARFTPKGRKRSAAEPMEGDNLQLADFYQQAPPAPGGQESPVRLSTLAPLHIINVTVNKTVDPGEQLVQRDRKGQPLAVLPHKFCLDGWFQRFPPAGTELDEIARTPTLGQWVGISGAAFSTGIGRATTFGMSMLMGAANVRLGVWWQSGMPNEEPTQLSKAFKYHVRRADGLSRIVGGIFRTQAYLSYEFQARFHGLRRQWQYLSDGGHFENTGLYELLRPQRKVGLVLATDCGADPDYSFDDLANLMRLVRIDFGVDVEVMSGFTAPELLALFGTPEDFRQQQKDKVGTRCALLLRASKDGETLAWVVLIKPAVPTDAPADVGQYRALHEKFPQEPTTDQFFDEAQWESYRKLGNHLGARLLTPDVMGALQAYTVAWAKH